MHASMSPPTGLTFHHHCDPQPYGMGLKRCRPYGAGSREIRGMLTLEGRMVRAREETINAAEANLPSMNLSSRVWGPCEVGCPTMILFWRLSKKSSPRGSGTGRDSAYGID